MKFGLGQRVKNPPRALSYHSFFSTYGWTWQDYQNQPEWVLEELAAIMNGIAEGANSRPAAGSGPGYSSDMRSAAEIAQEGGLPMPGGGFPVSDDG